MHLGISAACGTLISSIRFNRFFTSVAMAVAAISFGSVSRAVDVYHAADDGAGFSGFGNTNWLPSGAPVAGNNYFVVNFTLRTGGGAGPQLFPGNALNFVDGGRFYLSNATNTDVITVNNLNLDAAVVRTANANIQSGLAGTTKVTSNGAIFYQSNLSNAYLNLSNNISDAAANTGFIALGGNDAIGGGATNKRITVSGTNSYSGSTLLLGGNIQLASAGALPSTTQLVLGSSNTANNNGTATLDLNGGNYSVAGIAVQSYAAQLNQAVTLPFPDPNPPGIPTSNNRIFHLTNPIVPGSIKIGQTVNGVLSTGGTTANTMVVGIDYTTNDVILGDQTGFNNTTANITGLNFLGTQPVAGQVIGNGSTTSDATLTITGTSTFAGNIVDSVLGDPNVAGSGGTKKTNIAFTAAGGTLTLTGANTYTGTTSLVANSTLVLDYAANRSYSGAITGAGNVTKSSGGTLTLTGLNTFSGATTVNGGSLTLDFSAAGAHSQQHYQ